MKKIPTIIALTLCFSIQAQQSDENGNFYVGALKNFITKYNGTDDYSGRLGFSTLQLGNNGSNKIIAGRTNTGGYLDFIVNNTNIIESHQSSHNGIVAMTIGTSGNVGIGTNVLGNGRLTIQHNASSSLLRLENEGYGNESAMRFRAKSSSGQLLHADVALYATGTNQGYLGFKVPHNNTPNTGFDMVIDHNGYVGIGTNSPSKNLHVAGNHAVIKLQDLASEDTEDAFRGWIGGYDKSGDEIWWLGEGSGGSKTLGFYTSRPGYDIRLFNQGSGILIDGSGSVGIGSTTPVSKLTVMGDIAIDYGKGLRVDTDWNGNGGAYFLKTGYDGARGGDYLDLFVPGDGNHHKEVKMTIVEQGNVGIGTTTPTHKLEVNGTIRSKEVKVEASPWPDYVFEPDYNLLSLEEIEAFIKSEKHLPEIPSAKEMEANGVQLGEMNMLLLKKIEELTLHVIALKKENDRQQQEIESLKKQ